MNRSSRLSSAERKAAVKSAVALVGADSFTIDDPVAWEVRPERIQAALRTHSSCIPPATSEWSDSVPLPTSWAGWWVSRMTHAMSRCACGTAGSYSVRQDR